eukprot:scaffold2214_cov139-Cylindrotheca_fusiformis.AAC.9
MSRVPAGEAMEQGEVTNLFRLQSHRVLVAFEEPQFLKLPFKIIPDQWKTSPARRAYESECLITIEGQDYFPDPLMKVMEPFGQKVSHHMKKIRSIQYSTGWNAIIKY